MILAKEKVRTLLRSAAARAGSVSKLARIIEAPRTTLQSWLDGHVPASLVMLIKVIDFLNSDTSMLLSYEDKITLLEHRLDKQERLNETLQAVIDKLLGTNTEAVSRLKTMTPNTEDIAGVSDDMRTILELESFPHKHRNTSSE